MQKAPSPQAGKPTLEKSAVTAPNGAAPKLVTGQTAYQIFSTDKFIFKITPTFETLYRIGFHREIPGIGGGDGSFLVDGDSRFTYRRVRHGDTSMNLLRQCKKHMVCGFSKPFLRAEYRLYEAIDQLNRRRGYMIVKRGLDSGDERNQMYFILERK